MPRVGSESAGVKTLHNRSLSLATTREIVSGGDTDVQLREEVKALTTEERQSLLRDLVEGGCRLAIPSGDSVAMKADLDIPWNKLRTVRR